MIRVLAPIAALLIACGPLSAPAGPSPSAEPKGSVLVGTTTTTQDTGLLDVLIPDFERRSGWKVKLVVAGSGQILQQAARGDLDVILTHSPPDEEAFMKAGNGTERRLVMHNDFVLLGRAADPAGLKSKPVADALRRIADSGTTFVSRGDRSGTNVKELALWQEAGRDPRGKPWYVESGVGQLQSLQLTSTRRAYTMSDRGTWLANRANLGDLVVLVEGGQSLLNIYHVTLLDPVKFFRVQQDGARAFADYLVSRDGQALIAGFGVAQYGQPLFTPDAGRQESSLD